jgi:hypothetical protein
MDVQKEMTFSIYRITVPYGSGQWREKLIKIFTENGVAVVTGIYSERECSLTMESVVSAFEALGTGIDRDKPDTWEAYYTPAQTRAGMYQTLMSHLPEVWNARMNPKIRDIFASLYSSLRGKNITDFVTSIDGINIFPNGSKRKAPQVKPGELNLKDWPHLDQTDPSDIFKCVQGQLVLTNTTASFVCSPGSHHLLPNILELWGKSGVKDQWLKLNQGDPRFLQTVNLIKKTATWQVPIIVPKGSFIVWSSALIHSGKLPDKVEIMTPFDHWLGWRGVFYISYRPRCEFTNVQYEKIIRYILENRTMNHWNEKVFSKVPGGFYSTKIDRHPMIDAYHKNPTLVYEKLGIDPQDFVVKFRSLSE